VLVTKQGIEFEMLTTCLTLYSFIATITYTGKSIHFICTVAMETRVTITLIDVYITVCTIITSITYTEILCL